MLVMNVGNYFPFMVNRGLLQIFSRELTVFVICTNGRLEVYMKQNHENVERAETELNTLHEDMEQTLELQRRLAQR
jgi:hypothetical protein